MEGKGNVVIVRRRGKLSLPTEKVTSMIHTYYNVIIVDLRQSGCCFSTEVCMKSPW